MVTPREVGSEINQEKGSQEKGNAAPGVVQGKGVDPLSVNRTPAITGTERNEARSPGRNPQQQNYEETIAPQAPKEEPSFLGSLLSGAADFLGGVVDFGKDLIKDFATGTTLNSVLGFLYNVGEFIGINGFLRFGSNLVQGLWYKAMGDEKKAKEFFSKLTIEDAIDFGLGIFSIVTFGAGLAARGAIKGATLGLKAVSNHISKEVFESVAKKITREGVESALTAVEKEAAEKAVKEIEKEAARLGKLPEGEALEKIFTKHLQPVMSAIDKKILKALDEDAIKALEKSFEDVLKAGKNSDIYKILRANAKDDSEAEWMLKGLQRVIKADGFGDIFTPFKWAGDRRIKAALTDPENPESLLSLLRNHLLKNGAGETFEKSLREGLQNSAKLKEIALKQGKNFDEWVDETVALGKKKYVDELDNLLKKRIKKWVDEALKRVRRRRHRLHLGMDDENPEKKTGAAKKQSARPEDSELRTRPKNPEYDSADAGGKRVQREVASGGNKNSSGKRGASGPQSSIFVQHGNMHGIKMEGDLAENSVFAAKQSGSASGAKDLPHELAESLGTKEKETKTVGGVIDISNEVIKSSKPSSTAASENNVVDIKTVLNNAAGKDKAA